jgi:cytoskeletal protein RodZ
MPEARELRSVIEAAEQAASAGDYVTAELSLREAAALQETQLGPFHPDLANTLNNLAVVYERADSPAEAELCYRRAYAIATTAHAPDHPLVATSRKNLEDFCKARGRSFERSTVRPERMARRKPVGTFSRPIVVGVTGALGFAILLVAAFWVRSSGPDESSPGLTPTSAQSHERVPEPPPIKSNPPPQELTTKANVSAPREIDSPIARSSGDSVAPESSRSVAGERRAPATVPVVAEMAEAQLCRRLSTRDWRCDPVSSPVAPGPLFFYTRVKAAQNTTIEHRWYREDRLRQSVELRIRASPGSGYRTYTRQTVTAENAGNWRVELRTKDGSLLHEERFLVR